MTKPFDLEAYRQELNKDYGDGLLDAEELAEALNFMSKPPRPAALMTAVEERPDTDPIVIKIQNFYYRELFGRLPTEQDEKMPSITLVAFRERKPLGALWYAAEPTPDYQDCMYLDMLYVRDEFRGNKVATRLLSELLSRTEEQCIITYAWKPVIEMYQKHGFLPTEQEAEKEGQQFLKMALPLSPASLERYCRENETDPEDCYEEIIATSSLRHLPDFTGRFMEALRTKEEHADFSLNPLTVFLYQKAGLPHQLST